MAVEPLFVVTRKTLKLRLRLEGVKAQAEHLIDSSIETVRSHFYRRLGAARVAQLVAIEYVENATSETDMLRTIANATEEAWVRLELLSIMPVLIADKGGSGLAAWNDEGVWHLQDDEARRRDIMLLREKIESNLDMLAAQEAFGDEAKIRVATIGSPGVLRPGRSSGVGGF